MKTQSFIFLCLVMMAGCAPRRTILTVPAVSMTQASVAEGRQAKPAGRVAAEYCEGDDSLLSPDDPNVGLIDEAVMRAQQQSGALYLADVTISQKGDCVRVEALAMK